MKLSFGSKLIGTRLTAALLATVVLLTAATASAQSPSFDKAVLDLLVESRIQKPASQATAPHQHQSPEPAPRGRVRAVVSGPLALV